MAGGAIALAMLGFFVKLKVVTAQRDKARESADVLKAQVHQNRVQAKIKKEHRAKVVSHKAELLKELNKNDEEFEGLKNLKEPNDF